MISLASTEQADRYSLSWGGSWTIPDDGYSIASLHDKLWLPAEAAVDAPSQPSGDQQRFLLDVPPASGTAPTITLGEIKTRTAGVAAKLDAGDGSEEYRECVQHTYQFEGRNRYSIETGGGGYASRAPDHELDSGLAASSVVYEESPVFGDLPDKKGRTWLDGGDADLFSVESGDAVPMGFFGRWRERLHLFCSLRGVRHARFPPGGLQVPLQRRLGCFRSLRRVHHPLRMDGHSHGCPRARCTRRSSIP